MEANKIQIIRKQNLNKLLKEKFNSNEEEFGNRIGKDRYFLYPLLWNCETAGSREVTDKTARTIEQSLLLPSNYLDFNVI